MQNKMTYPGFHQDSHGMTTLSRVVLDAWLFGILPETEDCAGWDLQRMQKLMGEVEQEWDKYGSLPSFLPPELRQRHAELYEKATERAKARGWNPELGDDE
ncbi:MAG: hypothetical protein B7X91_00770 [Hydrogenophilales bacterium 17-64-11]|nr:MAG: hypothetical protein B7X91_00770 [Hydrogenophilales bacterium 17-64-11]